MSAATAAGRRRGWRGDTLALRLFLLMWAALVLSHVAAWSTVQLLAGAPRAPAADSAQPPPPGARPGPPPGAARGGAPGAPGGPGSRPVPPPTPTFPSLPPALPGGLWVVDYGVRFIVIALAAWVGSRWLAQPVSRLVGAAEQLGPALARGRTPAPLDEHHGTAEVRSAATVFNRMAQQLREVFEGRGLMMAAISHDLRTPLTRLRMRLETTPLEAQFQQRSVADLAEMNALIDAVLEVFRGSAAAPAPQQVDAAALVQALVDDRAEQGEPVALQPLAEGAPPAVLSTEPLALRRIVDNLVGNALRYAGATEVLLHSSAEAVEVQVLDRGPGIPAAELAAVMQPFMRLESSRNRATGGAGLGLFIARELAQRLGGTLTLGPRAGGGLQAVLRLPRRP